MSPDRAQLKRIVEAALLAADGPLSLGVLAGLFDEAERPPAALLREVLGEIETDTQGRGFRLAETGGGWRFQVPPELGPWVGRLWAEKPPRYSRALLETLAVVAYRQPVTRGDIEEIRGVAVSSNIMRTLQEREWVRVVGHRDVPGKPELFATTRQFLDYFNLKSLEQLPSLAEIKDFEQIDP
jgi:segregation and condensation protein B